MAAGCCSKRAVTRDPSNMHMVGNRLPGTPCTRPAGSTPRFATITSREQAPYSVENELMVVRLGQRPVRAKIARLCRSDVDRARKDDRHTGAVAAHPGGKREGVFPARG